MQKFIAGASLLSEALPVSASDLKDVGRVAKRLGGRLGSASTRKLNQKVGDLAEQQGAEVTRTAPTGGGKSTSRVPLGGDRGRRTRMQLLHYGTGLRSECKQWTL